MQTTRNLQVTTDIVPVNDNYIQYHFSDAWTLATLLTYGAISVIALFRIIRHFVQCSTTN